MEHFGEAGKQNGSDVFIHYHGESLTISGPDGEVSPEVARQVRNLRLLNVGLTIRKWMKQDIGENTPEFEEKFRERSREMGQILRAIFPEIGE